MSIDIAASARTYPSLQYEAIKNDILGRSYRLSLVFIGNDRARKLNQKYRNKSYTPNVLSFPLDTNTGEIYITPRIAAKESKKFNMTPKGYIGFLFIHGLLHLKGLQHGDTMEKAERRYCAKYKLT